MANTQKEQLAAFYEAHRSRGKYDCLYGGVMGRQYASAPRTCGDIRTLFSGHLPSGDTGIPAFPWQPFPLRALFALDQIFVGTAK